jgi:hypothetical protein
MNNLPNYQPRTLVTLTSRRFDNEPRIVEILDLVPGTACYRVDLMNGSLGHRNSMAFATASELGDYDPQLVEDEHRAAQEYWEERNPA